VIVVDASAAVELVLNSRIGRVVATRIAPVHNSLHAPHLIDLEVAQVLRRFVTAAMISPNRGELALEAFRELDVERHAHEPFLARIWKLRSNLTAYDASYVALAEVLGATLLTCDRKLAVAPGHSARVELIEPA